MIFIGLDIAVVMRQERASAATVQILVVVIMELHQA
jgi:hypothetical protein